MKCANCDEEFNVDQARAFFNHYFSQSSRWSYDDICDGDLCGDCAIEEAEDQWLEGELEDEYADDDDD